MPCYASISLLPFHFFPLHLTVHISHRANNFFILFIHFINDFLPWWPVVDWFHWHPPWCHHTCQSWFLSHSGQKWSLHLQGGLGEHTWPLVLQEGTDIVRVARMEAVSLQYCYIHLHSTVQWLTFILSCIFIIFIFPCIRNNCQPQWTVSNPNWMAKIRSYIHWRWVKSSSSFPR